MGMEDSFTSEAMSRRDALSMPGPTTWMERFRHAMQLLCQGKMPPLDLCEMWVRGEQPNGRDPLQDWAASNAGAYWMSGIGLIEAAETCANTPEEGAGHSYREDMPSPESSSTAPKDHSPPTSLQMAMTVERLHQLLGARIEAGQGGRPVCVNKASFYHPLEQDGVTVLDVTEANEQAIPLADDDGGAATNADGSETVRRVLLLGGGHTG